MGKLNKKYTIDQIKKAFWYAFHNNSDFWFDHYATEEQNQERTESEWKNFSEVLKEEIWKEDG